MGFIFFAVAVFFLWRWYPKSQRQQFVAKYKLEEKNDEGIQLVTLAFARDPETGRMVPLKRDKDGAWDVGKAQIELTDKKSRWDKI